VNCTCFAPVIALNNNTVPFAKSYNLFLVYHSPSTCLTMYKHFMIAVLLLLTTTLVCRAQADFWNSAHAYLGQTPPGDTPKIFAPDLLPDTGIAMDRVAWSADGKEFYYCNALKWFSAGTNKIKYFKYTDRQWKGPFVLTDQYYAPTFSLDDNTLYLQLNSGEVWQSKRKGKGWSKPELYLKKEYGLYDFMPVQSGAFYVGSNGNQGSRKDWSTYDFCKFTMSAKDTTIQSLGAPLNTPGFDGDFFIARDESYIIISAKETKDFECELYISYRQKDGSWSTPESMGPLINNGTAHRWGQYVTPDNKYLFYTQGTSEKECHIYWVRFHKPQSN